MKQYQGMYIIRPDLTEEQYQTIIEEMNQLFTSHDSEVLEVKIWGMRELAYEINDFKKGYYVLFKVNATVDAINEYNRIAIIREYIIRHIIVNE